MRTEIAAQSRRKERKMKASEMTNEMLADELEKPLVGSRIVIEAAARLRKFDITIVAQKAKAAAEGYAHGCEDVADLRRRLKVAADALEKLQDRLVSSVHDGTIDPHEALKIAEDAIAAIREEGGAK